MALEKNTLLPIIAALIAVVAVVASAAFVLTNNNDEGESKNSIVIEEGQTITQSQLDDLKSVAKNDSKVKLTYKSSNYTVVFDSKAIMNISTATELKVENVAPSSLDANNKVILADSKVLDFDFGSNTDFKDGTVTVTVPYELASGNTGDVVVSYIKSDKSLEQVNCTYEDGKATFTTNHFSSYAISTATDCKYAGLKVLGNVNGDNFIDEADATLISQLLNAKAPLYLYPIADANNDGTFDANDVTTVQNAVNALKDSTGATKAKIWHINYFDMDGNGTMDEYLAETTIPVISAITTGSANTFSLLDILGIRDKIKGASYGSSNDKFLYKDTFLNTDKCVKLGTSSSSITFEDGKAGSSDVIAKEHVTMVLSDWNRSYLTNEADFEKAGVDVVRVAAASFDKSVYTHSIMLLGTVFNKIDQATVVLSSYDHTYETINNAVSALPADKIKNAVASSMTGYFSSGDSDYTAFVTAAGAKFALEGFNFGGTSSIVVKDNLGVFDTRNYKIDNIVHIRTALTYGSTTKEIAEYWSTYANAMSLWEKAYEGQVLVSGSVPVPVRIAYIAYAIYGKEIAELNLGWADDIHSEFAGYYYADVSKATNKTLALTSYEYTVTVGDGVTVTDMNGNPVSSGSKFAYGTKLHIAANATKEGYILRADGSTIDDKGDFIVGADINARYVNLDNINKMTETANSFAANLDSDYATATAGKDNEGLVTLTYINYKGENATKNLRFTYYDTEAEAQAAYEALKAKVLTKDYPGALSETDFAAGSFDGFTARFSSNLSNGKYAYSTLYLCAYKGNMVVDLISNDYTSIYKLYTTDEGKAFMEKSAEDRLAYFTQQATKFGQGIATALSPASAVDNQAATDAASRFATNYTAGIFGTYTATDNTVTAVVKTERTMTFTVEANAAATFANLVSTTQDAVASYASNPDWNPYTLNTFEGLDGVYAFMRSKTMGSSNVSMLYVVAYKGDIVVDGATSFQYRNTGFATAEDVNDFLAAIVASVTA